MNVKVSTLKILTEHKKINNCKTIIKNNKNIEIWSANISKLSVRTLSLQAVELFKFLLLFSAKKVYM